MFCVDAAWVQYCASTAISSCETELVCWVRLACVRMICTHVRLLCMREWCEVDACRQMTRKAAHVYVMACDCTYVTDQAVSGTTFSLHGSVVSVLSGRATSET